MKAVLILLWREKLEMLDYAICIGVRIAILDVHALLYELCE